MTTPIFILSLPRSGSTLLQRLLLASGECATLGEPSFLLRLLDNPPHTRRLAPYRESLLSKAYADLRNEWPDFDAVYRKGVHDLALSIYSGLANNKPYFIDKTPRYSLIAEQIIETFPDAKFIFLWRHPGAIADSLARAYRQGKWLLREFEIDLFSGLDNLYLIAQKYPERIHSLRYEDLTAAPVEHLGRLGQHLGITSLEKVAEQTLLTSAGGTLGDQTGRKKYTTITSAPTDQWIHSVDNWYRRKWLQRIFSPERSTRLSNLGYTLPEAILKGQIKPLKGILEATYEKHRSIKRSHKPQSLKLELEYTQEIGHSVSYR